MKFSIIIPTHNPIEDLLADCAASASHPSTEVLIVDDGSSTLFREMSTAFGHTVLHAHRNGGPGHARNLALDNATGDWIVFLDSDDELRPGALDSLAQFITANPEVDAVGYGWEWSHAPSVNQRKDGHCLAMPKLKLLSEYLKLRMDGSVIFTAVKRELIENRQLRFRKGVHEDIDFIWQVYVHAQRVAYLPEILYTKQLHQGAITSTVTERHVDGFIAGWTEIGEGLAASGPSSLKDELIQAYAVGCIGVIATRVREIVHKVPDDTRRTELLKYLLNAVPDHWVGFVRHTQLNTLYAKVAKQFLFEDYIVDPIIFDKSWSCADLQGSLFLAPGEIRTCCKRFFVEGEMRGDVKLVDAKAATPENILSTKQSIVADMNKGDETPCSGCPFAEFKEWEPLEKLKVNYLSMEHHTVCNMKCSYCDEKFYGREQPKYDVSGLLERLIDDGALCDCHTVVWGGGEPTLGRGFPELVQQLMAGTTAKHRFLTNAAVFSPTIEAAIRSGRGTVTASVDAGCEDTFAEVRGAAHSMGAVLCHLSRYAAINAQAVTIKYILTDQNCTQGELEQFAKFVLGHGLANCSFQISCDFKQEGLPAAGAVAALWLHQRLSRARCKIVFMDDLLLQRLIPNAKHLAMAYYADWAKYKEVVVFGSGAMTEWMMKNSWFLRQTRVLALNTYIPGAPVLITGSQGYADNYRKALAAGVPESLIIREVIL